MYVETRTAMSMEHQLSKLLLDVKKLKTNAECLPSFECREISYVKKIFTKKFNRDFQTVCRPPPPSPSSEASPTICSCYANFNHYHYSFLEKLMAYTVCKHRKIAFACPNVGLTLPPPPPPNGKRLKVNIVARRLLFYFKMNK